MGAHHEQVLTPNSLSMYADLKGYVPEKVEFVLSDHVKEIFPAELDFTQIEGLKIKNANDAIKFVGKEFVATFPTGETVMRKLDEFEVRNIREEYCVMQENEVPKRKLNLEETLEEIKAMKKRAEQAYDSILAEVAKYAAEVKAGTREVQLSSKETFCIALAGYYAIYTYDKVRKVFVLAKAFEIHDHSELWANEEANREAMLKFFGLEFPETPKPEEKEQDENTDNEGNDLPFAGEEETEQDSDDATQGRDPWEEDEDEE